MEVMVGGFLDYLLYRNDDVIRRTVLIKALYWSQILYDDRYEQFERNLAETLV